MTKRKEFRLKLPTGVLALGKRTLVMGVLNVTPDSFSDGGKFLDTKKAIRAALEMEKAGADLLDVGAESTRPGSTGISVTEELRRLLPVLQGLRGRLKIPISVDTQKAMVAEIALGAGAAIINDISGLKSEPQIADVAARYGVPLILMHMRGTPQTMQKLPFAKNILREVIGGLRKSVDAARRAGVRSAQIVVDPGIGFGKNDAQNYELIARLPEIAKVGYPVMIGTSRKGFLGRTLARRGKSAPVDQRAWGTAATVAASILNGAHIVRVHDVEEMAQVCKVADCVVDAGA